MNTMIRFTEPTYDLWIGGTLDLENTTLKEALQVKREWIDKGYEDAVITNELGEIITNIQDYD
jgi:hypothetical protein